jgi:hypothetical protein
MLSGSEASRLAPVLAQPPSSSVEGEMFRSAQHDRGNSLALGVLVWVRFIAPSAFEAVEKSSAKPNLWAR